jgi:hypothetical protein
MFGRRRLFGSLRPALQRGSPSGLELLLEVTQLVVNVARGRTGRRLAHNEKMTQIALLASVSAVAWLALAQGTDPRGEVQDYLTKHRFTADEIAGLEAGDVIARATLAGKKRSSWWRR